MTRLVRAFLVAAVLGLLIWARAVPSYSTTQPAPVILVGVSGLEWSDVSAAGTPNLWRLAGQSAVAAVSVRTVEVNGCPADAWLTLNTGARTAAPRGEGGTCLDAGAFVSPQGSVARWSDIESLGTSSSYNPEFGLLAAANVGRGCATAIGPGAGLALADAQGRAVRYAAQLHAADLTACPLTVIDGGSIPTDRPRSQALSTMDAMIGTVRTAVPSAVVLLVGLPNKSTPHLQALLANGGGYGTGWLDANSTRHPGLVQLTDLTPTILSRLGIATPSRAVGSVLRTTSGAPHDPATLVRRLGQFDHAAQTIDSNVVAFYWLVGVGALVASGLLLAFGRSRWLVLVASALPVASFLANLLPWWRSSAILLWAGVIGWALVVGTAARIGPWRRQPLGSAGFVAAVTAGVLAADVVSGSRLQLSSLWGLSPLDAGRFYGFGNVAFGAFAIAVLVAAAWIASALNRRGLSRWSAPAVAVIGTVAVAIDGLPSYGADFGGVLALVPGVAVLVAAAAGVRLRARWVVTTGLIAVVAVAGIAVFDWSRPAGDRSHLGKFVQQALDGQAHGTLQRKLAANVQSFADRPLLGVLVAMLVLVVAVLVIRPQRILRPRALEILIAEPMLRPCLTACLITALIGLAVNDSGVIVLGICSVVALPLLAHSWQSIAPADRSRELVHSA